MLSAVIIAKNEEGNIRRCLESLKFCTEIILLDDDSTDNTAEIATSLGARVVKFKSGGDFSAIRNKALELVKSDWILYVDADEIVSPKTGEEILNAISLSDYVGYEMHRVDHLWGKVLKHGDVGSVFLLRLGRKTAGIWKGKVHEVWKITGNIGKLQQPLDHYPHPTLATFLSSINRYSSIRSKELYDAGSRSGIFQIIFYPLAKFLKLWIFKLGFLDGFAGLIHAMTMSFYSFLARGKLYLLGKHIPDPYFD